MQARIQRALAIVWRSTYFDFVRLDSVSLPLMLALLFCAGTEGATPSDPSEVADAPFSIRRPGLFELEPAQPIQKPPASEDLERDRLRRIEEAEEEEFSAPPLVVARISTLPAMVGESATQAVYRAERSLIRERARAADRLFRRGDVEGALALMRDTDRILQLPAIRIMALNRLAAYHFRVQQYEAAADYARKAWDLDPGDLVSASNLAAILLTAEKVDEALDILLRIYGQAFDRPQLSFPVHFNLACAYSMKGDETRAIQNLVLAAQVDPYATFAAIGDPHLDGIRDSRDFERIREALERLLTSAPRDP